MTRSLALATLALGWILGADAQAQAFAPDGPRGARIAAVIARVAPDAPPLLERADQALSRHHVAAAREALERAQTSFLNARLRGERGMSRAIDALATARTALDRGDLAGARGAIQPLLSVTRRVA